MLGFADNQMTSAIIDRLAHHGRFHLVVYEGESYQMKHAPIKEC